MHPVLKHARGEHHEVVSKLQELLYIKDHLGSQTPKRGDPSDLDKPHINILPNNPIHLLLIKQEATRSIHTREGSLYIPIH
jgi:hypothetical protein